jgi:riboflavin transporter FmnP
MVQGDLGNYLLALGLVVLLVLFSTKFLKVSDLSRTERMTNIAIFSALAFVFMFVGFPIIPAAPYLKVEFSVLVILILALRVDYKAAIMSSLIVNILDYIIKNSAVGIPIDQTANFLATLAFVLPILLLKDNFKDLLSIVIGVASVTVLMVLLNYLFITPFYFNLAGWPLPENLFWYCLSLYGPFNLIKWGLVGISYYFVKHKMA